MEELDAIRERIKKHRLSFVWLIFQLGQRGIATDKTRKGAKADSIIQATISILDDYEQGKVFVHDD